MKANAPKIVVTSRKRAKAKNKLLNEIGLQRAAEVKRAKKKAEEVAYSAVADGEVWTDERVLEMVKEVTRKG
jgi:hypothetical protein